MYKSNVMNGNIIDIPTSAKIQEKIEGAREERQEKYRIRRLQVRIRVVALVTAGVVLAGGVVALLVYRNQPIQKVTRELISDAGLYLTDDGKTISGVMTEEELVTYIKEHNLTEEDLEQAIQQFLKRERIDIEFGMSKVRRNNQGVFMEEAHKKR